jgi:hypothetical protein
VQLLMYVSDAKVQVLCTVSNGSAAVAHVLLLLLPLQLAPGGVLFFRESCFRPSGDRPRKGNPTHYRCAQHLL